MLRLALRADCKYVKNVSAEACRGRSVNQTIGQSAGGAANLYPERLLSCGVSPYGLFVSILHKDK